ncbi:MAG: M43 family zinc metalloprotease [Bacteroidota bacterium]
MNTQSYLLLICLLFTKCLFAQSSHEVPFTGCASDQVLQSNSSLLQKQQLLDNGLYESIKGQPKTKPSKGGHSKALQIIPVVVHIVHNGGIENISDAQVVTAIANFNTRFAQSPNNQIQFCLAQRDPNGNATTGITRDVSALTTETMESDDVTLKDINRWTPTCYLNIWVVKEIMSVSAGNGVVGYAFFPSAHGLPMDGIVIEAGYFGSSYENDAVGVHEAGHYLGLYHTFEGGCTNADCLLNGDRVCDTPPDQTTFASCNPPANSCSTDADDPSANNPFSSDVADLSDDYMDYSNLSCYDQFTQGQYDRMYYFLTTTRQSLLGCLSCTPPCQNPITTTIDMPALTMNVVIGTTINFSGTVTNTTNYEWYLVPGNILSTTLTASYTFNNSGSFWMKFRGVSSDPDFCLDGLDSVLIIVSAPVVTSCNGSLLFDNVNNISVDLPLSNQYYSGANNGYTWECWFKLNDPFDGAVRPLISSVDQVVFEDMWLGFGWQGGFFNEPVNRLVFKVDGPNSAVPSAPNCSYAPPGGFQIGTWYHAAGVMDYSIQQAKLYLDGQLVDTRPITTAPITRDIPTELSYNWNNTPYSFRGNMDEVRIWGIPRTATEIATYYNQCVANNEPDLLVYYHCNQAAGSTVIDATPNNADGTFSVSEGWSAEEPSSIGTTCIASCIEICGNGIDDNNDGFTDEDCNCPPVYAGNDTIICSGTPVQLSATPGFDSYSWSPPIGLSDPNIQAPVANPVVTTDYTVTASVLGPELAVNGDFSAGNVGFTNTYTYSSSYSPCNYYVNNLFFTYPDPSLIDHTPTADGLYLSIDGCAPASVIWEETIMGLDPNTNYGFKFWASRADQVQPNFEIHLIGDVTGDLLAATQAGIPYAGVWTWDEYGVSNWNSSSNTSVTLRVVNIETNSFGNDFGVDDFSFRKTCEVTDIVKVTVQNTSAPQLNLGPDLTLCESGTQVLVADPGFQEYVWNDGSTEETLTVFGIGTYWVTVTDSCGNMQTDTVHISLIPSPELDLGQDLTVCSNSSIALTYTSNDTFNSFAWSPSNGLSCVYCSTTTATVVDPITYYLTAFTPEGCMATDSVTIFIGNTPIFDMLLTVTDAACDEGGIVTVEATSPMQDLILYNFNNGGFSVVNSFENLQAGVYPLSIQIGEGICSFDTTLTLTGEDNLLYIPNSFTPNSDTYNETWSVSGTCFKSIECRVYNRWGEEIALIDEVNESWDGTYHGKPVPDGVYSYSVRIVYENERVYYTNGFVAVLK